MSEQDDEAPSGRGTGASVSRRDAMAMVGGVTMAALAGCHGGKAGARRPGEASMSATNGLESVGTARTEAPPAPERDVVLGMQALGSPPWPTEDPFLFCVHHVDHYPVGTEAMGPEPRLLEGRRIGMDFANRDGWNMYHGDAIPGFPRHPHRGFETVTVTRRGHVDHSDSMGATARYGEGDVQWLTAGRGISHAEMFPLLATGGPNPTELFQIWLNLPSASKMVEPAFAMLWSHTIPVVDVADAAGRKTTVTVVAGGLGGAQAPPPTPNSWAARAEADVAIWSVVMAPGARWVMPAAAGDGTRRTLYVFAGAGLNVGPRAVPAGTLVKVDASAPVELSNGAEPSEILVLQGKPIGEPVAHRGPFVMTTQEELRQAFTDYQRGGFGGWPWPNAAPVHPRDAGRFARHADGRVDKAGA